MEFFLGTDEADVIQSSPGPDIIVAGAGDDIVLSFGVPINDGRGFDFVRAELLDQSDLVLAGDGNDLVRSGGGVDYLDGEAGADTLAGGVAADSLWGGAGNDVFRYEILFASPGAPSIDSAVGQGYRDVIWDFVQGEDLIDLRGWENANHPGAHFIGEAAATFGVQLLVGVRHEGGNTIVELSRPFFEPPPGSTPGYFGPAGEIELVGNIDLQASDFIFSA